jgi:exportin-T
MYFENVVRYAKYFPPTQPQYLVAVLAAFLDSRGIRHPQLAVRQRVCYLFRQFVKAVRGQLFPYLDNIVDSLRELLVISYEVQKSVPFEDQVNFYESLGVLIGSNTDVIQQQKHAEALVQPALAQLEQILAKELYKTDNPEKPYYATILVQLVTVIGSFSKGFSPILFKSEPPSPTPSHANSNNVNNTTTLPSTTQGLLPPARACFLKALDSVLRIPAALPAHYELREKVFFFMHRMVDILGPNIFPVLPTSLALLLANTHRIKDGIEYVTLANQLISRFKEALLNLINDMLMPSINRIFEMLNPLQTSSPNSEEQREMMELQKHYYLFLQSIFNNNIAGVFTSPNNVANLQQILETVVQGCVPTSTDVGIPKVCIAILRRMIEEWGSIATFNTFLYERIVPRLFELVLSPSFDLNDASSNALVIEVVKLQKIIAAKRGVEFQNFLLQVLLPNLGCPPEVIQQYVHHLDKSPVKQFQDFFKNFIRAKRT